MLTTVVTKKIITTRETLGVGAARNIAVESDFRSCLFHVLTLMTSEVLRVEEPLTTRASVRPLITAKMYLKVATVLVNASTSMGRIEDSLQFTIAIEGFVAALESTSKAISTRRLSSLWPTL